MEISLKHRWEHYTRMQKFRKPDINIYYLRSQKKGLFWPPGLVAFPLQRDLWLWVSGFEWPSPSLKWTPDGTGPLTEKGAWRQHSDPWGRRTETWLHAESADPKTQLSQREEKRSWTSVTMSSSPEASSHRALYLLLCMLTSQQRSISFMSRAQWLRTPLWVNNIPKYQSCDWIQPLGKVWASRKSPLPPHRTIVQDYFTEFNYSTAAQS